MSEANRDNVDRRLTADELETALTADELETAANCWSYLNKYVQWAAGRHVPLDKSHVCQDCHESSPLHGEEWEAPIRPDSRKVVEPKLRPQIYDFTDKDGYHFTFLIPLNEKRCPKCHGEVDCVDCDEVRCTKCGLKIEVYEVAVWRE